MSTTLDSALGIRPFRVDMPEELLTDLRRRLIVSLASGRARLALSAPASRGTFPGHKIEAIACRAGVGILGTDDENHGGRTTAATFCR
jgi:hypothetical protein